MPDLQKIRELVEMMVANDLVELTVRDGDQEIKLRRPQVATEMVAVNSGGPGHPPETALYAPAASPTEAAETESEDEGTGFVEIRSPMVGTFYAAPDPDSPSYVKVGDHVGPATVVCVLEAMKVFSEIKAEVAGRIERILVKNGEAVEFGQPLFVVRPD